MNHSPVGLFLFSIFFSSHVNRVFHEIAHLPIGILDRSRLLSGTDKCVLKYLNGLDPEKSLNILELVVRRCALSQYFVLESYGNPKNGSISSFFPLFQHPNLRKCNGFVFFGTTSYEMSAELEILTSADFQMFDCKYLIIDKRKNINGLKHYIQVPELSELHLNDIMLQFKDDKEYVIEHLFITAENREIEKMSARILNFRRIYSVLPCQITIRFPELIRKERIYQFAEEVLRNEQYVLLDVRKSEKFVEFYMLASSEYQCMMRYV